MELVKAVAAVLVAGIVFMGSGMFSGLIVRPGTAPEANKVLQVDATTFTPVAGAAAPAAAPTAATAAAPAAAAPAAGAAAPAAASGVPPVGPMLASADADAGKSLARRLCATCHTFEQGQRSGAGPNLWNVVGAPHGHAADFNYSAVLKAVEGPWDYEGLNRWLANPREYAAGNRMAYPGLRDPQQRANVIAYLRSLSDSPKPLP